MKHFCMSALFVCSTDLGDLAHATVTALPAETVGPAEVTEIPNAGEVLPQQTTPMLEFGKEVGSVCSYILYVSICSSLVSFVMPLC